MNQIRQYRPAFFEGFENELWDFETTEDLLKIPFVKKFHAQKYSMSRDHLMAEFNDGKEWWVVGFIKNPDEVVPPAWKNTDQ